MNFYSFIIDARNDLFKHKRLKRFSNKIKIVASMDNKYFQMSETLSISKIKVNIFTNDNCVVVLGDKSYSTQFFWGRLGLLLLFLL